MYGYKQDRIRHVYLINEIIKRHRKLQNKSQEDLSKYIYTLEHISRVETGNKTPNTRNFHLIMEELGMSSERYQSSIFTEDYKILEMDRSLSFHISKFQYNEAEKLFFEIASSISSDIPQNKQFLIMIKAIIDHGLNRISDNEKLEQCEEALRCTIPSYERGKLDFVNIVFSENEIALVSNIASTFKKLGELNYATNLLKEMIEAYRRLEVGMEYHIGSYTFLLTHYASNLGLLGQYTEAIDVHKEVLRLNIVYGYGDCIDASLYGISWNMLNINKDNNENACKKLCRQAYTICEIMGIIYYSNWYNNKYMELFGNYITCYEAYLSQDDLKER